MSDERCERTELLVTDCAHCRGNDNTIEEQAEAERLQVRARLLSLPFGRGWFPAVYGGKCWSCGTGFAPDTAIRRATPAEALRGVAPGYIAECCAGEEA